MPKFSERVHALILLRQWVKQQLPPEEDASWGQATPLTRELVIGSLRHKGMLDAIIDHLSARPPSEDFRPVLWIGLLQILVLDGIATHAAVFETLEAAQKLKIPKAQVGYANGLLRNVIRTRGELEAWLAAQPPAVRFSHPELLVKRWTETWNAETAASICEWNQKRAATFARLTQRGRGHPIPADLTPHPAFENFYQLPRGLSPVELPGFDEGHWYIQDPSTALAPALLDVQPGETVLDACAAPGGKTAILAEALGNQSEKLTAMDTHPRRLERMQDNMTRLQFPEVQLLCGEMSILPPDAFDAVLLDVPCSNTGVLQRRPDARWRFSHRSLKIIVRVQREILDLGASRTRPGGRLVYSTCSIEPEETTRQIEQWLKSNPDWTLVRDQILLPGEKQCDGAYAAFLQKNVTHLTPIRV
ncbi:MAG: hypothetical protein JJU29_14230 [Verrucomicrobia bacterium]|nr:hypothetical protein [Verrucomicrobiota bacterium]MCH8513330.1 hypothetical protein [Kiritimatiellia bacterium]